MYVNKASLKNIIKTLLTSLIIFVGILFILYANNNLKEFIDLCILQVGEFIQNKTITVASLGKNIILMVLSIIIAILLRKNKIEKTPNTLTLIFFALGVNLIIIPIVNEYHVIIANILWEIIIIYETYQILEPLLNIKQVNFALKIVAIFVIVILATKSISKLFISQEQERITDRNNVFLGAILETNQKNEIDIINRYVKNTVNEGKDVKILSTSAMLYSLNLKLNNWYFDLPLTGNMGKGGEEKAIEKINTLKNTIILVETESEEYKSHYQFMDNIRKHVENNYKKIDELYNYNIYEIN